MAAPGSATSSEVSESPYFKPTTLNDVARMAGTYYRELIAEGIEPNVCSQLVIDWHAGLIRGGTDVHSPILQRIERDSTTR